MSKYISSNELWDKICNNLSFPNSPKGMSGYKDEDEYGSFTMNHYNTGFGIKYSYFIAKFNQDTILENTNSFNTNFICINTGKSMYMEDAKKSKKVKMDTNVCWNGEMKEGHLSNSLYSKNQRAVIHNITFDNTLFKDLTKDNVKYTNLKNVYRGDYIDVNFNNKLNSKQKILLNDLLNISNLDNKLQMLYLESKLLDFIYTTINSAQISKTNDDIYLSIKDIESLHKAKALLLDNIENPLSLKDLSYKSAINEFKLKKGFKQLFGNTVYGYLQEHRLNKAKELLENNEINIGEASLMVGYKSISHFSKIFKEYFGITPIQIKKESRTIYY